MPHRATGAFQVKMSPLAAPDASHTTSLGLMRNEKTFTGDLAATSGGWMVTAGAEAHPDSAVYVLIERVVGTLHGRTGAFVLHHSATLDRGRPTQLIQVAPDSGSGELEGLTGQLTIRVEPGGAHFYDFAYDLP